MVGSPARKEKTRIIRAYIVFRTSADQRPVVDKDPDEEDDEDDGQSNACSRVTVLQKVCSKRTSNRPDGEEDEIDEKAIALLSLPDGVQTFSGSDSSSTAFHTFLITRQNGDRMYGSAMLLMHQDEEEDEVSVTAHCLITTMPFVVAARHLLTYFVHHKVPLSLIHRICNLKVPSKGKCLKLLLPGYERDVVVFRGSASYPLLDYPLRELLTKVLSPETLSLALVAALLEFQIVILAKDYYQLMLVSESLTSLLLPFSWPHVYVPILPAKLGLNYLDAPTPYIMGLNVNVFSPSLLTSSFSSLSTHTIQCRIFCHENRIQFAASDMDEQEILSLMPSFQSQLSREVDLILRTNGKSLTSVSQKRESPHKLNPLEDSSSYLHDLKLNQLIRMTCMTCLNECLLNDFEKFVVVRGSNNNSRRNSSTNNNRDVSSKFDYDSYLRQQRQQDLPFLHRFIETQMFASIIDQKYKLLVRRNSSTGSGPEQDSMLLKTSAPIDSLSTVDEFLGEVFQGAFDDATIVNLNEPDIAKSCSSPLRQRKVIDLGSKECHKKVLPDVKKNSLDPVVHQLQVMRSTNKSQVPDSEEIINVTVPNARPEADCVDSCPPLVTTLVQDEEDERLASHLRVCEAEKEKLRGQIHRLCQENVTLRDELADSQVRLRTSAKYTKQLEDEKRHLEFLLSMKQYDDFKSSQCKQEPVTKSSLIHSLSPDQSHGLPVVNTTPHQIVRLNPKSPAGQSVSPVVSSAGSPQTPTRLKGLQSRVIQYYNKVLTRIND